MERPRGYRLYVIELGDGAKERFRTDKTVLYVGQSWHPPEVRLEQHLRGIRAARHVKRFGGKLRPDLYHEPPVYEQKHQAERAERQLGNRLKHRGFHVIGPNYRSRERVPDVE